MDKMISWLQAGACIYIKIVFWEGNTTLKHHHAIPAALCSTDRIISDLNSLTLHHHLVT